MTSVIIQNIQNGVITDDNQHKWYNNEKDPSTY